MVSRNCRVCSKGWLCFMTLGVTILPLTSMQWPPATPVEVRWGTKWTAKWYHEQVRLEAGDAWNEFIWCNSPFRWIRSRIWISACMILVPANLLGIVLAFVMLSQPMPISAPRKVRLFTGDHQLCAVSTRQLSETPSNGLAGVTAARKIKDMLVFNPLMAQLEHLFIKSSPAPTDVSRSPAINVNGDRTWQGSPVLGDGSSG